MQEERRLAVLRAIVEDFVATEEPVGSKALVERHGLNVSPATVRNDMAALEDEGYITQPHTSAGRVPTDKGYRLFVDRLTTVKPMSVAEKRAISTFLDGAVDLDDVVNRSVRVLSQLTRQVAVVQYPTLSRSTVRHVELVRAGPASPARRGHPQHRPGRAAAGRARRRPRRRRPRGAAHPDQPGRRRASRSPTRSPRSRRIAEAEPGPGPRRGRRAGRGDERPPLRRARSPSAARPTWPASATASSPRCGRCSRRSRSTSCSSSCSARPPRAAWSRSGSGPRARSRSSPRPAWSPPATGRTTRRSPPSASSARPRMDYPGTMAAVRAVARYVSRILDEA